MSTSISTCSITTSVVAHRSISHAPSPSVRIGSRRKTCDLPEAHLADVEDVEDAVERHVVEGSADVVEVRGRRRMRTGHERRRWSADGARRRSKVEMDSEEVVEAAVEVGPHAVEEVE